MIDEEMETMLDSQSHLQRIGTSIVHRLPHQSRLKLMQNFNEAVQQNKNIQRLTSRSQKFNKDIFNKLNSIKVYDYEKIFNFDDKKLASLSVIPIVRTIVLEEMKKLIQIEFQIDIFTKKFIKMPSGVYVHDFVSQTLKKDDIFQIHKNLYKNYLKKIKGGFNLLPENKEQATFFFFQSILEFVMRIIEKNFGFMIKEDAVITLLLNPFDGHFVHDVDQIIKYQTNQIVQGYSKFIESKKEPEKSDVQYLRQCQKKLTNNLRETLAAYVNSRQLIPQKPLFFSIVNDDDRQLDLKQMKLHAYNQQIEETRMLIEAHNDPRIADIYSNITQYSRSLAT